MKLVEDIENKNLKINFINKEAPVDNELQKNIEEYWNLVKDHFTRGRIYAIKNINENENNINIDVYYTDYAYYLYSKRHDIDLSKKCNNIWAGILIETSDKKYVFGRMSENTSTEGEYHISGGSCDERDVENGYINYEETMFRELKEEFNLDKKDFLNYKMKYLKLASKKETDVGVLYKGILNKTSTELEKEYENYLEYLKNTHGEIEFTNLVLIDKNKEKVKEFLEKNDNILMEFTKDMLLYDIEN